MHKNKNTKKSKSNKMFKLLSLSILFLLAFSSSFFYFSHINNKKDFKSVATLSNKPVAKTSNTSSERKTKKTGDAIPASVFNSNVLTNDSTNKDIRKFPYPYNAMLSFCSDIDDTTLDEFKTYHQFLNTLEKTQYGQGIGLDIGDSMWMFMGNDTKYTVDKKGNDINKTMTFYKGTNKNSKNNSEEISHFTNNGWIDSIHTFGDFSRQSEKGTLFTRNLAIDGLDTLKSINFKPTVWINHGNRANKQNFGAAIGSDFMNYQEGDKPTSPYYHIDLTLQNGIKYIWNSFGNHVFGYDYPLFEISLRDGKKIWGFHRYTNNLVGNKLDWTWTPKHVYRQITPERLDSLVKDKQYSIVAQHFGIDSEELFSDKNIQALRLLKKYETDGKILVTRTSRLLNYANTHKFVTYNKVSEDDKTYINIISINDPVLGKYTPTLEDIRGLTFYCDNPENTELLLNKEILSLDEIQKNSQDETGRCSISIKYFKPDYTDYTKTLDTK